MFNLKVLLAALIIGFFAIAIPAMAMDGHGNNMKMEEKGMDGMTDHTDMGMKKKNMDMKDTGMEMADDGMADDSGMEMEENNDMGMKGMKPKKGM